MKRQPTNQLTQGQYVGRFAPSPTGPLHMGSLVAATASYLRARQQKGKWLLRIEDIDPPREVSGAKELIIDALTRFGFQWDGPITYQSERAALYIDAKLHLEQQDLIYRCDCSRRSIRKYNSEHQLAANFYAGLCRQKVISAQAEFSWRLRTEHKTVCVNDAVHGVRNVNFDQDQGDFLVWRKDNLPSYQLAVTVDDYHQGITEIVRGSDLLGESAGQALLRQYLNYPQPHLLHIPIVRNKRDEKLSKGSGAAAINAAHAADQLCTAYEFLGLDCSDAPRLGALSDLWLWAVDQWDYNLLI